MALPSGLSINYKYDGLGRRIQRTTSAGADQRYIYDGEDALIDLNADWSVATTYLNDLGFDKHLRQTSATTGVSYDAGSFAAKDLNLESPTENDAYDNLNRLTTITYPTRTVTYAYDPLNNMTRATNENVMLSGKYSGLGKT